MTETEKLQKRDLEKFYKLLASMGKMPCSYPKFRITIVIQTPALS